MTSVRSWAKRRFDMKHGTLACATKRWRLTWTSRGTGGSCRVNGASIKLTSTLDLPRWVGTTRVDAREQARGFEYPPS